ncbi:sensor histidine kinase [Beggiatoa leptomitoformis]|uniref:histidine kinase n=1 Tax=Beggiatoa leptomitoformis TaxID=288004 RepID=A0A2N9YG73_9GAMM|nr:sensor histidine kinase [Beggiatoa leptomitoformis]ALG68462.1 histidine kinase [Beggiatoa leptomitoformis]AUI69206.1 histidine kinase [Beggiatoa leptomitoformis]
MLQHWVILLVSFSYLGILFGIAYYGDKRADSGHSLISNPYVYTLSIAIYCTAWSFYGSVGRATTSGMGFLPIYLGATLTAALFWLILRKIIRIAHRYRITSIADFIGSRYGKSASLSGLVTIIAVIGILPYIALQLKAISSSLDIVSQYPILMMPKQLGLRPIWFDTAFYIALILAIFTILFGTRHLDATERHEGMVAAIAFESIVKLLAFLAVGIFVTWGLFTGPTDLFTQAFAVPELQKRMTMESVTGGYINWFTLIILSMCSILFLPRQFQVGVVENVNEQHLKTASWLFPLYLLIINIFVFPIALAGQLLFTQQAIDPDTYVLTLPMFAKAEGLTLLVFIGGLSAAASMVIVETIALATMVSNDLLMPILLRINRLNLSARQDLGRLLLLIRRCTIACILLLGYGYYRLIGESYALVTIGLVSFAAAAQFAPAIFLGIYWKGANRQGALVGLSMGFFIWSYTLLLPAFAKSGWLSMDFIEKGLLNIALLKPYQLFGLTGLDNITHAVFWSLFFNLLGLIIVSLFSHKRTLERLQASLFVDVFHTERNEQIYYRHGQGNIADLKALTIRFLGEEKTNQAFKNYAQQKKFNLNEQTPTTPQLITFVEQLLTGAIGSASAHIMVASVIKGEPLSVQDVLQILEETSQVRAYSRQLEQKSHELEMATRELRTVNERLQELDHLKDEFVATVSHELRTPLTSIRAFSEILLNNPTIDLEQRQQFLDIIVKEAERLTRLINDVLDLAKIESGRMEWHKSTHDLRELITTACAAVSQLFHERHIHLLPQLPENALLAEVDRDRLIQVLINLLSNASKFTEAETGQVIVRLLSEKQWLNIEVEDNGSGIPATHLQKVFEKFHQVDDQQAGKPKGTGLGLTICQRIVEQHGGKIWAENIAVGGVKFIIRLPNYVLLPNHG